MAKVELRGRSLSVTTIPFLRAARQLMGRDSRGGPERVGCLEFANVGRALG